ncbi:MAG: SIR2 family protein [Candidatus Dadabacteria bacterium]|nr:SIR2 family protein [Candidatus Dadabacteria bacterium]
MSNKNDVCLFLGAGASRAFGFPTTVEFIEIVNNFELGTTNQRQIYEAAKRYFLNRDIIELDIEKILLALDKYEKWITYSFDEVGLHSDLILNNYDCIINKLTSSNKMKLEERLVDDRRSIQGLKKIIYTIIYDTYWKDPDESEEDYREAYKKFLLLFSKPLDIFTTNYDLCIENTFWNDDTLDGQLNVGFEPKQSGYIFNNQMFHKDGNKFHLHKLHGSLNWKRNPKNKGKIYLVNIPDLTDLEYHPMLFPGGKNFNEFPFNELYNNLKETLKEVEYCIVIGFSFRDEGINDIFKQALNTNKNLKLLIWNKDKDVKHGLPKGKFDTFFKPFGREYIDEFFNSYSLVQTIS